MAPERREASLEVGRIGRAHGLRGEVAVTFTSNRPERWQVGSVLRTGSRELLVVSARPHQQRMLLCFEGVEDRDAAEQLLGAVLTAGPLPAESMQLGAREHWVHELVGSAVVDLTGRGLGVVVAVEANPAHDLLVLDNDGLIPMVFVVEQREGEIVVDPPEGLLEI